MRIRSETTTTATTLSPGRVGWGRGDILDTSDAHASTGKSAESRLGTGAGSLGTVTTSSSDLDVESGDSEFLAASGDILGCQHGGVGRALVTVGLDLHATGDTGDGFAARQIGDVDEGVIERGKDTGNTEDEFTLADLGSELDVLLRSAGNLLLGRHFGGNYDLGVTGGFVMLSATAKTNFLVGGNRLCAEKRNAAVSAPRLDLTFLHQP